MNLLEILKRIRDEGPCNPVGGICGAIEDFGGTKTEEGEFQNLYKQWPRYSGSEKFPVPGPDGNAPTSAFVWTDGGDMWNPHHPYGAARLELLNWCIEQLETEQ